MTSIGSSIWGRAGIALSILGLTTFISSCSASGEGQRDRNRPTDTDGAGGGGGGPSLDKCTAGTWTCDGNTALACDGEGGFTETRDCASEGLMCEPSFGCVTCPPSGTVCDGNVGRTCNSHGTGYEKEIVCDELQGMTCTPFGCRGDCSPEALGNSYIGCDYYPTVTFNSVFEGFSFAVAVGNAGDKPASIVVTRNDQPVRSRIVPPGSLEVIRLPWVPELKGPPAIENSPQPVGPSRVVAGGSYRLRSTQPVTVYQFNPLEYELNPAPPGCGSLFQPECRSYSNDASLLLPATTLTGDYTVLAWPSGGVSPSFYTVTATQDATTVHLKGRGSVAAGGGVSASGDGTVSLNAGDVLAVLAAESGDVSGSRVQADKPVQVIAGQACAGVPEPTTGYCDHIEEAMFPVETLGKDYLVTYPAAPGADSPHTLRIAPILSDTKVTFDPPIHPETTLNPGQPPLQIKNVTQDVRITADQAIIVAQYMHGSSVVPSGKGDPSQSLAIATEQFRKSYLFLASSTYDENFVNVIAKTGSSVTLDGSEIPAGSFSAIGGSGYSVARVRLSQTEVHNASSSEPFGIVVYGYGSDTSYMYPGGLDLEKITETPPR